MGCTDGWVNRLPSTLLLCTPTPRPGHCPGAHEPPSPSTAVAAGAGMLSAAPKGGTEVGHPRVSVPQGAQRSSFAGGGDGLSWTTELGLAALGQAAQAGSPAGIQLVHQTAGTFNLLHTQALVPCLFSGTLQGGAYS